MPVALFTNHAYGSWLADRPQGYVKRRHGIQPQNLKLAAVQRSLMTQQQFVIEPSTQRTLIERFLTVCDEENYRAHAAASDRSHIHLLTSWRDQEQEVKQVGGRIKNLLSLHLSRVNDAMGTKWLARGASRQQVDTRRHFEYLTLSYLPKHRGWFWSEREGWREPL